MGSNRIAGFIFLSAVSVYAGQAIRATSAIGADSTGDNVRVLSEDTSVPTPVETPTTTPAAQPEGATSVTTSVVKVDDDGLVDIHVNDASLVEVLRMLSLQAQRNIVASKGVSGTITANLFQVTVNEALDAILLSNGYVYREQGNFIYVYAREELAKLQNEQRTQQTEVFRLYYTPALNATNMIKPVLSEKAQVSWTTNADEGLESGTSDIGGNAHATEDIVVVTDFPENLERVRKVLAEIDRRPQQILIEATILRATLTEDNMLGVDFTVLGSVDFNSVASSEGNFTGIGTAANPANRPVSSVGTGNSFTGDMTGGLKVGIVTNNVAVFLSALESITDTVVLANPKVLALNKQKGEVIVGRKDGYLTTTVTESSTVQTVEFLDTGTRLIFRPFIGDDGYIRLEIHPEDSSGGLSDANLPFKVTTEVTTNVMVKDGNTIVIGGLFREDSSTGRSQVPFLGNIPIAGQLFRRQRDRTTREEVIILLTPHIIQDEDAYTKESMKAMGDAQRMRVGIRKGMMPWGRERMAELSYEWAQKELAKPNPDQGKVLWHLNVATNLNPHFMEAIKLKEKISGAQLYGVDNSTIRDFLRDRVMASEPDRAGGSAPQTPPEKKSVIPPAQSPVSSMPMSNTPMDEAIPNVKVD